MLFSPAVMLSLFLSSLVDGISQVWGKQKILMKLFRLSWADTALFPFSESMWDLVLLTSRRVLFR